MIPWTLARAVGGYLVARKFRAKMAEKMPQNKTTPFVRQRCAIGAVVTRVGNRASVAEIWPFEIWPRAEGGGGGVGPFCDPPGKPWVLSGFSV